MPVFEAPPPGSHYASVYFHRDGPEVTRRQRAYEQALASAIDRFRRRHQVFCVLVGSEKLDRRACEGVSAALGEELPTFVSDDHDMYGIVGVLRQCRAIVSSRYHAIVTSMPAGVPSAGVTMDERIRNLMADRGQPHLSLEVDDPGLADHVLDVLEHLFSEADAVRTGIERCVARNLETMGTMGQILVDHTRSFHPELPFHPDLGEHGDPWDHLPPLHAELRALVDRVRASAAA